MEHEATSHHTEHPPTTIRQYVLIGLILTAITAVELWLSYSGLPHGPLIAGLLILSAVKFAMVVALFMHLRFDNPLFWRLFVFGLALAASLLLALIALFADAQDGRVLNAVAETPATAAPSGEGGSGEGAATETPSEGEGEGGAEGEFIVAGLPAAEFFQANCSVCHGADRGGMPNLGLPLLPSTLTQPDEFYEETITNGRAGTAMPPWSGTLSPEDISTMVDFLQTVEP